MKISTEEYIKAKQTIYEFEMEQINELMKLNRKIEAQIKNCEEGGGHSLKIDSGFMKCERCPYLE